MKEEPATSPPAGSHPGVRFPPPLLFAAGLAIGWALHRAYPLPLLGDGGRTAGLVLGWAGVALAGVLLAWALLSFARARTAILPNRPARMLVLGGPYRFTRNPMYVGMVLLYLGATALIDTIWTLPLLPLVLWILHRAVVRLEERYLAAKFGADYEEYRRQVRRWL